MSRPIHHLILMLLLLLAAPAVPVFAQTNQEPTADEGEPAAEPAEAASNARQRLIDEFGYEAEGLDDVEELRASASETLDVRADVGARMAEVAPTRARLKERASLLGEFAAEEALTVEERAPRVRRLALAVVHVASTEADVDALAHSETSLDTESALLGEVLTNLEHQATDEDTARTEQLAVQAALQKELEEEEAEARRKAEQARRREEATKDAALKQLYSRERELRDQLVQLASKRRELGELKSRSDELSNEFAATKGEILGDVDKLPEEPTTEESREEVDPLLRRVLQERRELWSRLDEARSELATASDRVAGLTDKLAEAKEGLESEQDREEELGGGALWKQRVEVAETEVELRQAELDAAQERAEQVAEQVDLLEHGVEFFSKELREIVDRASSEGRNEVYGILNDDALSDAWHRLNDRYHHGRKLLSSRLESLGNLNNQWLAVGVWAGGLFGRLIIAMILMALLRFVPGITRGILDFLQARKFFRRRPSLAIKLFEVLRVAARPLLLYAGVSIVLGYVIETFAELRFVHWGVDAFFVYLVGVRVVQAIALPRWHREREGFASSGTEDDLRPDEAAMADILRIDIERGTKLVRSAKIVLLVGTVWYFAPSIVVAITGVSVLSGLITNITRFAILVVVYWMLSTWRNELSALFTRLAGDRIPKATKFVENHKDRPWGVLVVAVVSIIVLAWELEEFVRRAVKNTEWFKKLSAYAFKTKIELQQREETPVDENEGTLPAELVEAFSPQEIVGTPKFVERESMTKLREEFNGFVERGNGALCVVGEPGIGKSTTCRWLLEGKNFVELQVPRRIARSTDVLELFRTSLDLDVQTLGELTEVLQSEPPTVFLLDGLERCFIRDIDGYAAYRSLLELVHRLMRKHVWLISANKFGWEFLTRVYDQRHVFTKIETVPRWSDEELRKLVEQRMAGLPYTTSFSDLADLEGDYAEVIKTARGYYRYLAEFTRGIPTAAMHYWLKSLSGGARKVYSVGLFNRPSGGALVSAPPNYRFILAAITQHGVLSAREVARVDNTPEGICELAAEYFLDAGAIERDPEGGYSLANPFLSLTLRHLEDSNLL